jgi:hypothetical protein
MIGGNFTTSVSDTEEGKGFGLGDTYSDHQGKEYVWVQASGAVAATDVVIFDEVYQAASVTLTTSASAKGDRVGVAAFAMADNDYGWVQVKGPCTVNVATSCAVNTTVNTTASAGRLDDDATTGAEVINGLVTTGAESGNAAAAMLVYPTVGATL